jgi:hypothetical protein
VLVSLFGLIGGMNGVSATIVAGIGGVQLLVLLRFGLLSFMVQAFLGPVLPVLSYSPDLSRWYAVPPLIFLSLTAAAAIWAFRLTLPDRVLIPDELLYR